jgi:hypothetical protein
MYTNTVQRVDLQAVALCISAAQQHTLLRKQVLLHH